MPLRPKAAARGPRVGRDGDRPDRGPARLLRSRGPQRGEYAADRRIGLRGALSRQGRRATCRAGGRASFAEAASLKEIGGRAVGDEAIRRACPAESKAMAAWRAGSDRACAASAPPTARPSPGPTRPRPTPTPAGVT